MSDSFRAVDKDGADSTIKAAVFFDPSGRLANPTMRLGKRDRYLDSLLAVALISAMTYHVFEGTWLSTLFPSMGVMFALAGALIAGSLDRSPGNPWRVLRKRSIHLLPPVWLFGLVTVPIMLVVGWTHSESTGAPPLNWQTLLFWVVPISNPPASTFGADWVTPLWFIRSYLWFLLLSPATLWLSRRWPKRMISWPLAVVLLSALGLLLLDGRSGDVILSVATFGGCWMLGFAHHDNKIRPLPLARVLVGGATLMALGLLCALTYPDRVSAHDIANIPMANTLYSLGAVLILLRLHPDFSWMDKHVALDKLITVINSRAMTIYLWGSFATFLANPLLNTWSVTANLDPRSTLGFLQMYLVSWLILTGFVFTFGWCEDLAGGRRLRINPWPRSNQELRIMRSRRIHTFPAPTWMVDLTPQRLFLVTSCLLAAASTVSVAALAGTGTPGRTNPVHAPSRNGVNLRSEIKPPASLGQGNGQEFQFSESLEKVKSPVLGVDRGVPPAITKVKPTNPSTAQPPVAAGTLLDLGATQTTPLSTAGVPLVRSPASTSTPTVRTHASTSTPTVRTHASTSTPTVRSPASTSTPTVRSPASTSTPTVHTPVPKPVPTVPAPAPTTQTPAPKPVPTVPAPAPTTQTPAPTPVPTVPEPVPTVQEPVPTVPTPTPITATPLP